MNVIMGIILIGIGVLSATYIRMRTKNNVLEIKYMQTKSIAELKESFEQMESNGLTDYHEFVELKGNVTDDTLVEAPFSNQQVAYCESKITKIVEREERYRDSQGRMQTRIKKDTSVISDEKSSQDIFIKDSSSEEAVALEINATGCKLDIPKTFDRFENTGNLRGYRYFNSWNWNEYGPETTGFTMEEKTIKKNQNLYVIGEAYKVGNTIHIGKPTDSKKPFIVTTKSEEDLINSSNKSAMISLIAGVALAIIGIIVIFAVK